MGLQGRGTTKTIASRSFGGRGRGRTTVKRVMQKDKKYTPPNTKQACSAAVKSRCRHRRYLGFLSRPSCMHLPPQGRGVRVEGEVESSTSQIRGVYTVLVSRGWEANWNGNVMSRGQVLAATSVFSETHQQERHQRLYSFPNNNGISTRGHHTTTAVCG